MNIIFGAGGTGGHIVPALALADHLRSAGHVCRFIGNVGSMEERLSGSDNYPFHPIKVQKLYRKITLSNVLFPFYLYSSIQTCRKILQEQQIHCVIATGGFVAGPVALAAIKEKIPCFLHESNSYPGLTTRYLAKRMKRVYISFEDTRKYLPKSDLKNLGIPIQPKVEDPSFSLKKIGLDVDKKTILISGGSQGSLAINNVVAECVDSLLAEDWQLIWQTGSATYERFASRYVNRKGLYLFDFSPHITQMMRLSQLAITRAGAMTLAELCSNALPAILIPLPTAAENHQYFNAVAQEKLGFAKVVEQLRLNAPNLLNAIRDIDIPGIHKTMAALPQNKAAENITNDILSFF